MYPLTAALVPPISCVSREEGKTVGETISKTDVYLVSSASGEIHNNIRAEPRWLLFQSNSHTHFAHCITISRSYALSLLLGTFVAAGKKAHALIELSTSGSLQLHYLPISEAELYVACDPPPLHILQNTTFNNYVGRGEGLITCVDKTECLIRATA